MSIKFPSGYCVCCDLPDVYSNAQMPSRMVREGCALGQAGILLLKTAMERLQLSARAYDELLKVARTAAYLAVFEYIEACYNPIRCHS